GGHGGGCGVPSAECRGLGAGCGVPSRTTSGNVGDRPQPPRLPTPPNTMSHSRKPVPNTGAFTPERAPSKMTAPSMESSVRARKNDQSCDQTDSDNVAASAA